MTEHGSEATVRALGLIAYVAELDSATADPQALFERIHASLAGVEPSILVPAMLGHAVTFLQLVAADEGLPVSRVIELYTDVDTLARLDPGDAEGGA